MDIPSVTKIDQLTHATVRVVTTMSVGTGFFIAPGLIATCAHVAGVLDDRVDVQFFDNARVEGTVVELDADADVAVIAVGATAWPVLSLEDASDTHRTGGWLAYGHPRAAKGAPVLIEGDIRLVQTRDSRGRAALQLFSHDSAAGKGAYLDGFSGSAVVSRGCVIGQLRTTPKDKDGRAELGLIFAAPAASIRGLVTRRVPLTKRRVRDPEPPNARTYDPTWYVHRPKEEQLAAEDLEARKPVVLVGPRFFGKSSLLKAIVDSARNRERQRGRDARVVEVDFGMVGLDDLHKVLLPEFFVRFFEAVLSAEVGVVAAEMVLTRYVRNNVITGPRAAALLEEILMRSENPLYLVLSRAEALVEWPSLDAFVQSLRAWASSWRPAFQRLRVLAELSTAAALVSEVMPSFNVAPEPLPIGALNRAQTVELARLYELSWSDAEIDALLALVGGHPYLLRRAMYEAARDNIEVDRIIEAAEDDGGVFRQFLNQELDKIKQTEALRNVACSIACGSPPPSHPANAIDKLCAAGIIIRRGRGLRELRCANPLFERHLLAMCAS